MWTFCKVSLNRVPSVQEWRLRITDGLSLILYHEQVTGNRVANAFNDEVKVESGRAHYTNRLAHLAHTRGELQGKSFAQSLADVTTESFESQQEMLDKGNVLYINSVGGWSYDTPDGDIYTVLETIQSEDLHFPELTPRFIQWPNGTHWYAKVGDVDIEWGGKCKWDTREEAETAARRYLGRRLNS